MKNKGKIISRISWTDTLRGLEVGQVVEGKLADRINIVRHIARISKIENKKFSTHKVNAQIVEIRRLL